MECIIPGNADGMHDRVLHWVIVYGFSDGEFWVCDPLSGRIRIPETEMEAYMDAPIGKLCITVEK